MKNLFILALLFFVSNALFAQGFPSFFTYQGIARAKNNKPIKNEKIAFKFEIRRKARVAGALGGLLYGQEDTLTTDSKGFFSVVMGKGFNQRGAIEKIWGIGDRVIHIFIDTKLGGNYIKTGSTQLVWVPLALTASEANNPVVDNLGNHQATRTLNLNTNSITNVKNPSNPQDAATKNYVDTKVHSMIADSTRDTRIDVEVGGNGGDNKIHFYNGGTSSDETMTLSKNKNGVSRLELLNSTHNTIIGKKAGIKLSRIASSGDIGNTFMGVYAGEMSEGGANTFIGMHAGQNYTTGSRNIFVGVNAGRIVKTGNVCRTSNGGKGNDNTFIGHNAGTCNNNASGMNTFLGAEAGKYNQGKSNVFIGWQAGSNNHGNANVFIGREAGAKAIGDNKLYIHNSNDSLPLIYGEFDSREVIINGNPKPDSIINSNNCNFWVNGSAGGTGTWNVCSDRRLKTAIQTIPEALKKLLKLRGVTYHWKDAPEKGEQIGFIAQEVDPVMPQVVSNKEDFYTMQYAPITALLVEGIKSQQDQIEDLTSKVDKLEQLLLQMQKQLTASHD